MGKKKQKKKQKKAERAAMEQAANAQPSRCPAPVGYVRLGGTGAVGARPVVAAQDADRQSLSRMTGASNAEFGASSQRKRLGRRAVIHG